MTAGSSIEDIVAAYLDARECGNAEAPEVFAARHGRRAAAVLDAIRLSLEAETLLPREDEAPGAPASIAGYRVVRTLGRGGMGVVYEVEKDGVRRALKRLPIAPLVGPRALERFRRETEILARLDHPGIVRVHDSGMFDETPYLVMDLVEGSTLAAAMPALPRDRALHIFTELCDAVHAAHEAGVIHRDLKPQNVIVRSDGAPVLLDFGLGRADELPSLTSTGEVLGTPRYMAPEQVREEPADRRTDVHALGLILYEIAVGRAAYDEPSRARTLARIRRGSFPRPRAVFPSLPAALDRVVRTALAFDPRRRYPTALELSEDVARFLRGEPVHARPPGILARARQWTIGRRSTLAAAALVVALAAVATWAAGRPDPADPVKARAARDRYHVAVGAYLDGRADDARAAAADAVASDPSLEGARALYRHLRGEASAAASGLHAALDAFSAGDFAAARRLCEAGDGDVLSVAILGLCALDVRDLPAADRDLVAAAIALPTSRRLAEAMGDLHWRSGRLPDAEREITRALAIGPERAATWTRLAEVRRARGDLDGGIVAAERAIALSSGESAKQTRLLASLFLQRGDHGRAQSLLEGVLAKAPKDVEALVLLASSHDSEHRIVEAERGYRAALALRPRHVLASQNLANLYLGADLGRCKGCDRAYAEHPEFLRPEEGERLLLSAIREDAGRTRAYVQNALGIAGRLRDQSRVVEALRELVAGKEKTQAVLELEWLLRRLELNDAPATRTP